MIFLFKDIPPGIPPEEVVSQLWLSSTVGIVKMWQLAGVSKQMNELLAYEIH